MINKNDLISIIVKPTNACNLRCKHCYHAGTGYDNEQMSDKMLEKLSFNTSLYRWIISCLSSRCLLLRLLCFAQSWCISQDPKQISVRI